MPLLSHIVPEFFLQRRLLDVLDRVEVDNLPLILSVANLCSISCVKLLERCLEIVVRSNLDMITLEKALPPDVVKQIVDARLSLGLVSPGDKGFPNIHVRRVHRALDSDDVELVRMLLTKGKLILMTHTHCTMLSNIVTQRSQQSFWISHLQMLIIGTREVIQFFILLL
jgi:hypothetical protein